MAFVPQMEATECGAASLAMVLGWHGHHAALPELRAACGVSRDGASALALVRAARTYGLEAVGVKAGLADLPGLPCPAILHWGFDHFLVLERASARGAVLVDPASGRRRASRAELDRNFTGAALLFQPGPTFRTRPRTRPSLARYRRVLRESLPALAQVALAALALQVVGLAPPVASQILLDRVILPRQEAWLWGLAVVLGLAASASTLLALVQGRVVQSLAARLDLALGTGFVGHLLHLPWAFFLQRETGDLLARLRSNAAVRDFLGGQAMRALLDGALAVAAAALMVAYSPRLGGLVILFGLVQAAFLLGIRDRTRQLAASELASAGRESGALVEALSGFEALKACGAAPRAVMRWAHRMTARMDHTVARHTLDLAFGTFMTLLRSGTGAVVFLAGGREVLAQRMTLGVFTAFLALQGLFMAPLMALLEALDHLLFLGVHLQRLDDVLDTPAEPSGTRDPGRLRGAVHLEDVRLRHAPGAPEVLRGITLDLRPGEKVALVGPSGAGKSTLARVLLGLHRPTAGRVALDGMDLAGLNLAKVRAQMGVVLQEPFLFDATVAENLAPGGSVPPPDRIRAALRAACVEDVVDALPGGWHCRLGENGAILSGGQRQRLCLARALACDPAILLLDEATSSVDLATEARIHANLAALGCTRIVIAHRLATVRDADRVLVMEAGRIVQEGSFEALRRAPGPLRDLAAAAGTDA